MLSTDERNRVSVFHRRQKETTQKKVTTPKQPPLNVATAPEDMTSRGEGVEKQKARRGPLPLYTTYVYLYFVERG